MAKEAEHFPKPSEEERRGEVTRATPMRAVNPFEEMDRLFESFFPRSWMRPFRWERPSWAELTGAFPRVDVIDRDADILLRAEVPGIRKEDLDITTTENTITIKGECKMSEEKGEYYRSEIAYGAFSRTIALPSDIDASKAKAKFDGGILEMTLPKVEKSKRHTIKVE